MENRRKTPGNLLFSKRHLIMGTIVCATRGGEGSRAVQTAAIRRAKATGSQLKYLYIADPNSLDEDIDEGLKTAILAELYWFGGTLLRIAHNRAEEEHLDSEIYIREGHVVEEIIRFAQEVQADLLLLGAPRGTSANVFGDDTIEQLARQIEGEAGVRVEIIRPNEG